MNEFTEKMTESAENLVDLVQTTLDFGFDFEEAFPAEAYTYFHYNGKKYRLKLQAIVKEV